MGNRIRDRHSANRFQMKREASNFECPEEVSIFAVAGLLIVRRWPWKYPTTWSMKHWPNQAQAAVSSEELFLGLSSCRTPSPTHP